MNAFATAVVSGLVVIAVSGLTFVAYKHPDVYAHFHRPLLVMALLGLSVALTWESAVLKTFGVLVEFIDRSKGLEAIRAHRSVEVPYGWTLIAFATGFGYLELLSVFPRIFSKRGSRK